MSSTIIGPIKLNYTGREKKTADLIAEAGKAALALAEKKWGLKAPMNCQIYVMTTWLGFIFKSAPLMMKLRLIPSFPLWAPRIRKAWPVSTAWSQRYASRIAIGIKPARLIEKSDRKISERMSIEEPDPDRKIKNVAFHEIIHACTAHLRLPAWLDEGLAQYGTEVFAGKPLIQKKTLEYVRDYPYKEIPPSYGRMARMNPDQIVYHDSRAYWIIRYLEELHPGLLTPFFTEHIFEDRIESKMAEVMGIEPGKLWTEIDAVVTGYFLKKNG